MRTSQFPLFTVKETPADADTVSHQLMLRSGMLRKIAAGIYTWTPLGLRVLRKVEAVVREEMNRAGALELLLPCVQPKELWEESGRWDKYGGLLLRMEDRKKAWYCFGPTHEEVICDLVRNEVKSYKQLPITFYQIQTKFRDEIRPRFGVMRAREFIMKDAYSFHADQASLDQTYRVMYEAYTRIFTRLGLKFRAVAADSGDIGGDLSHEFQVLADSGEDAIAFSDSSDYAANVELAEAIAPSKPRPAPTAKLELVATPDQKTIADVTAFLGVTARECVKALAVMGTGGFAMLLVRGDHEVNETKVRKLPGLGDYRLATDEEIEQHLNCRAGYIGPANLKKLAGKADAATFYGIADSSPDLGKPFTLIVDRSVNALSDFVCGSNRKGYHYRGFNLDRDLVTGFQVADIRKVVAGDPSPDGKGKLAIARGIEVGHIFENGRKYTAAMHVSVLDQDGKTLTPLTGCYGIGVSRIVAAAIEQNHDARGIVWPMALAPFQIALLPLNMHKSAALRAAADELHAELLAAGYDVLLDDRELRPGPMFADAELIGCPHRLVLSERGLNAGTVEYKGRRDTESHDLPRAQLADFLRERLQPAASPG